MISKRLCLYSITVFLAVMVFSWIIIQRFFSNELHAYNKTLSSGICKIENGCYISDDFNGERVNEKKWRYWDHDPEIKVFLKNGLLTISGKSSVVDPPKDRVNSMDGVQTYPLLDIKNAVARIDIKPDFSEGASVFHYCGLDPIDWEKFPDRWYEIAFYSNYLLAHYVDADGPSGYKFYPSKPYPEGFEKDRFYKIKIVRDAIDGTNEGFIFLDNTWQSLSQPTPVYIDHVVIEIKAVTSAFGVLRNVQYDNFRLYPDPKSSRVHFKTRNGKPYPARIKVLNEKGHMVGEINFAKQERGYISLNEISFPDYPASFYLQIFDVDTDTQFGEDIFISAKGIQGLYPEDLWKLDFNKILVSKKET